MPFCPHAQGTIERFNYSIKKYLTKEYITNGEKIIDFKTVKNKVINFYNNKFHRLIGMTPNEAYKITDKKEINKINEIKIKEYEKINKKTNYLNHNGISLLNPKFLKIGKNTLVPNRVKKGKFANKIPVRVLKRSSYGYYLVKICINYTYNNIILCEGSEYVVDCVLLKKNQH